MLPTIAVSPLNQLPILQEVDILLAKIETLRPFPSDIEQKVLQKLRFDWNYHSNAIEGNSLTYGETITFLMEGLTAKGKPLKDHLDIKGHNKVVNFLLDIVRNKYELTESDIRSLHKEMLIEDYYVPAQTAEGVPTRKLIKVGEYKTEPNHVQTATGEMFYYARPEEVPARMADLLAWYRENKENNSLHPIVLATLFHYEFVLIHPFADGNGRMSRWLMNLILLQAHYPIAVIKNNKKQDYYAALRQADAGNFAEFVQLVSQSVLHSLQIYEKAIKGESIAEPTDLDKEIALLSMELKGEKDKIELERSPEVQLYLYENSLKPLVESLDETTNKFKELFMKKLTTQGLNKGVGDWEFSPQNWVDILAKNEANNFVKDLCIRINFFLIDFKKFSNTFSLKICIDIKLQKYNYEIFYSVNPYSEEYYTISQATIFQKPYHQQLSHTEIQDFCTQVGQEMRFISFFLQR